VEKETKDKCESPQENHSDKEDNRLPYEAPLLRKHGKISDTTLTILGAAGLDAVAFAGFDISD